MEDWGLKLAAAATVIMVHQLASRIQARKCTASSTLRCHCRSGLTHDQNDDNSATKQTPMLPAANEGIL